MSEHHTNYKKIYFILLGLGFMLVEIPLLQKGALYLGHPTYSLTIVLFSILTFTGVGSYWSGGVPQDRLFVFLRRSLVVVALAVAGLTAALELIIPSTIGLHPAAKAFIMIGLGIFLYHSLD